MRSQRVEETIGLVLNDLIRGWRSPVSTSTVCPGVRTSQALQPPAQPFGVGNELGKRPRNGSHASAGTQETCRSAQRAHPDPATP